MVGAVGQHTAFFQVYRSPFPSLPPNTCTPIIGTPGAYRFLVLGIVVWFELSSRAAQITVASLKRMLLNLQPTTIV